jgi:hypothetical protein
MFRGFSWLYKGEAKSASPTLTTHQLQGAAYCAALNIHRTSDRINTAEAADRLASALANIEDLARALESSSADVSDIVRWRSELASKAAELRSAPELELVMPRPQLQIDPTVLNEQVRRRATA